MELIKAPNEFLEKKVQPFDFATLDAEKISKEIVSLPIYYGLDMTSQNKIIKAINSFTF